MAINAKNILLFTTGQLGDTLASVPSIRSIRNFFPDSRITLLYDKHVGKHYVSAPDVLKGSGLVDDFLYYPFYKSKIVHAINIDKISTLLRLRALKYDTLVYLVPSRRTNYQIKRDIGFFHLAGIKQFIGTEGFLSLPEKTLDQPLPQIPHESDQLLSRLAKSGIPIPPTKKDLITINIGEKEEAAVKRWLTGLSPSGDRQWIAVGPGSKMPVKVWPTERYLKAVQQLIQEFDIWPVVFGGPEDKILAESMASKWARGYVAAGFLKVRESIAAMKKCAFYLGNDSGTMHMAVAAGLKCIAIFSSRDYPGKWEPRGHGHTVFRASVPCEGCLLDVCNEHKMKCILSIKTSEVCQACKKTLREHIDCQQK